MSELLQEYDRQLRREPPFYDPAFKVEREGSVVRLVGSHPQVLFAGEGASVDRELERFAGRTFEWRWCSHDSQELRRRLLDRGFKPGGATTVLTRDVPDWIHVPQLDIQRLAPGEPLAPVFEVHRAIWPGWTWLEESLERERRARPDSLLFYVVYNIGRPVASCWIRLNGDFASFCGGSVLPEARGHGYYKAMVAARLRDARGRARWAVTNAGEMSRPILEKLGWMRLTDAQPLVSP